MLRLIKNNIIIDCAIALKKVSLTSGSVAQSIVACK